MDGDVTVGITGAGGYIGSCVATRLRDNGYDVVLGDTFRTAKVDTISGQTIQSVDIRDRETVRSVFSGVDVILHLAAISGVPDCHEQPEAAFDVNVQGTENVAWYCHEQGIPLVFAGSMAILGDPVEFPISPDHPRAPVNLYGRTKQMSEADVHALAEDAFPALVLMKSNIYGYHRVNGVRVGKETVINKFVAQACRGDPLTVYTPGTQARDFIHIQDVARAYEQSLETVLAGRAGAETLTIASGECLSVEELADIVQRIAGEELGEEPEIVVVDNPREFETVTDDFTVETQSASEAIGFEAKQSVASAVREMIRDQAE